MRKLQALFLQRLVESSNLILSCHPSNVTILKRTQKQELNAF
ncbi:Uncharacterised protein [Moraxella ovis]|nr:Uncharacterised protein [Moraxella ovis]STZ06901.1 Uncharacterised protein [Moraxella ovis]